MSHRVSLRGQAFAQFAGRRATNVIECVDVLAAPERLREGLWFVVADFAGQVRAWRFAKTASADPAILTGSTWQGPPADSWASSMSQDDYELAVRQVQQRITVGEIAQVNVCRVLSAGLPRDPMHGLEPDAAALAATLATGNPAPYAGAIHVPGGIDGVESVWVVTASPESYLSLSKGSITSSPMKGTARTPEGLTAKDRTENMLVTDAVREEVALICEPGTTQVKDPLRVEQHPGLVQLVSVVGGRLRPEVAEAPDLWRQLLSATFPPGSVAGVPKPEALALIDAVESAPRGPYCGAIGWVDGDAGMAELAVGIRTFWWADDVLRFGTGAGITAGSDPAAEWAETELKAARLIALASKQGAMA